MTRPAARVREVVAERREFAKTFELSDGRREVELSTTPIHYRDGAGRWLPVGRQVVASGRAGFGHRNAGAGFATWFGDRSDRLVRFELGGRAVQLGVPGTPRRVQPSVDGRRLTFAEVFGDADVRYTVGDRQLKEDIVLAEPPAATARAEFRFDLALTGLQALALPDGSIGFYPQGGDPNVAVLRMPKPFMVDSAVDRTSPTGTGYSTAVTQSIEQVGGRTQVVLRASESWLRAAERKYPVRIDPTLEIAATDARGGQDAEIISGTAGDTNFGGSFFLDAGAANDKRRSLLKFDLSSIPRGTPIDSAQLRMHYDTTMDYTGAAQAFIEPRPLLTGWDESTVTWNSIDTTAVGSSITYNLEQVDDQDEVKVSSSGPWPVSPYPAGSGAAIGDSVHYNTGAVAGDTFRWTPDITETGDYRVDVWYTAGANRSTAAPFVVTSDGVSTTHPVDQTMNGSAWVTLGTHRFSVGGDNKVVLKSVAGKVVVADAVRFVKSGHVVKPSGDFSGTHYFSVRSALQQWLAPSNPLPNNGLVLKLPNAQEGIGTVGPRYISSEGGRDHTTGGSDDEESVLPKLIVRYGRSSVDLAEPSKITSAGAELSWVDASDPRATPGDAPVEYQVHRLAAGGAADPDFEPSNATLVATLAKDQLSFADTTAAPNTGYYYRIAVLTKDGELAASRTVHVSTPSAGRVIQVLAGGVTEVADTTLSAGAPTQNQDVFNGQPRLSVGNTHATYGNQRAVLRFDTSAIPAKAKITNATMSAWKAIGAKNAPEVVFDLHRLSQPFVETQATWNQAANGSSWPPGGAHDAAALASAAGADAWPARMNWTGSGLAGAIQGWVDVPGSNHGVLMKLRDEAGAQHRLEFWSGEYAGEPALRPHITVEYVDPRAATFYAPETPQRMIPNINYRIPVTVTNTTRSPIPADTKLSYVWILGTREFTATTEAVVGEVIAPGGAKRVDITLMPPVNSETGNKRLTYQLNWDLKRPDGSWMSTDPSSGVVRLAQPVDVEERQPHDTDPSFTRAYELGLEKFFQYTGVATGAGSSAQANLHNGNLLWTYAPISNPSIGPSTFVRLTYNSLDGTSSQAGHGFSLQTSTLTRNGAPLVFNQPKGLVSLIDGDGSSQIWLRNSSGVYEAPAGVFLALKQLSTSPSPRAWVMTRPDGTKFFFDEAGYQTEVRDPNGNSLTFSYDLGTPKRLRKLTDASGRTTLDLVYDAAGRVQSVTDISGRVLTFGYDTVGKLVTLTDAAPGVDSKVFEFVYSTDSTSTNIRLSQVRDPQRPADQRTRFGYIESTTDSWSNGRLETITDRRGKVTRFGYTEHNGATEDGMRATVTDANQHASTYVIDDYGRPSSVTNAKGERTTLVWDGGNNVSRLTEPNGALTTWTYDLATGYPLTITDAEQNRTTSPKSTRLTYASIVDPDGASVKRLSQKVSPLGAAWQFDYDSRGNLTAVTDPAGTATSTVPDDYKTTYLYDTARGLLLRKVDANGHATVFSKVDANNQIVVDYDPSGSPRTITDAYGNASSFGYDPRGSVTRAEDANHAVTTQTYDGFGRPRVSTAPIDAANNLYATSTTSYDRNDNVIETIAANDAVTTNTYDAGDLLVESRLPRPASLTEQRRVTNTYDPVGNLLTTIDPIGNATTPAGHTTSYAYDQLDRVTSATDAKGGVTGYSYDTVGNLAKVVDAVKSATPDDDFTARYGYDLNHRRTTVVDAAGRTSRTRFDPDGKVTETFDADGNITSYSYDPRGLVTAVKSPYDLAGPGADYNTAGFRYDQVGNRTEVIQPRGMATALAGDFTEVTEYDALNRPVRRQQPFNSVDPVYKTPANIYYTYDKVSRLTAMSDPTDTATKWWTRFTHFDNEWIRTSTDPFGIRTDYGYNRVGQQTARTLTSAAGTATREMTWDYDLDGSLKSRSDAGVPGGVSEVLADNSDQRETTPVGTWPTASAGTGFWGYNYQTHAKGTGTNTFSWDLVVPTTGSYEVKVRYPEYTGAASNAQFTVNHATGSTVRTVDQRTGGGTWVSLGSYTFAEGTGKSVKLTDAADGVVLADAVMLVRNDTSIERARRDLVYRYDLNGNLTSVDNTAAGVSDYAVGYDELNRPRQVVETTGSNTATTAYSYDPVGRPDTVTIDPVAPLKDQFYDYTWDVRGLLASVVTGASASDPAKKTTSYSYDNRGLRRTQTKGNGNKVAFTWFDNGLMASLREVKPDGKSLVAEHLLQYDADGNRVSDAAKVLNSDTSALDSSTAAYSHEPRGRVTVVDRSGAGASDESYVYSASSNITSQAVAGVTTNFVYDRNRLQKSSVVNGPSAFHNHDPFGRLDTITSGGAVIGRYVYDGFDRIVEQLTGTGTSTKTTRSTFDAWDRPATKTDAGGKTTAFSYLGLSSQLLAELDTASNKQKQAYTFDAYGQRLTQTTTKADGTSEDAWYGYNPHSDVETLTTVSGATKSTYGYTAYGKDRAGAITGVDKPGVNPEPYNLYRFNAKRWDAASGDYDMGFRTYNPGLNRFTSRDMYNGALADLNLGTDPWNTNRYAFAGGNPVTGIELDGHCAMAEQGGCTEGTGVTRPASTVDASDDPTVTTRIGRHEVTANDGITYHKAYVAARSKLVGTGGGQGPELAVGCTKENDVVMDGDRRHSCGSTDVEFANKFAAEMCRQSGLHCTRAASTDPSGAGIYEFPAGFRIGGGPESARIGRPPQAGGGYCSFSGETRVLMADGTTKPISKIKIGDRVMALDPKSGKRGPRKVTRL